ncbi:conserved hypothetical protein [Leishmania infantum JPCM5]|uniref:Uncharacterized protein n=3 Tax=Leishmania donovani species complex TaxID=38574 RepID=A4IAY3_LEIIN|nr:conserved hypothetical protein [Leishmania infantum JPCM5]XP_003864674.1 hypothetical protein, conserved [Leishmania donovani]CAC9543283.1 hypothetical_protein_-_conserved [Leishmania infantum]AYU82886.1 hypothetical protein LdCL_350013600 [Leishmania donovani]CAM71995.1 conserved hypothetical protein [Leishmania infantum JPCM5]CBZ37993.1 hypothetical protein, conserved [Leishmania donovani]SUZ45913.1 hypothetical_protein_-_conserved [Leishmania infantum]|eukprot:XP_001468902.1 conserved hypothetical protein [Leishmania infantum JPCM5]
MKRSYRDNKPRFHKHRQGKMLLPHNHLAGLFFTVNPRQEPRAQREAQLYLSTLTSDLEAAHEAFVKRSRTTPSSADDDAAGRSSNDQADVTVPQPSASLSSLLAAELAACSAHDTNGNRFNTTKRPRSEDDEADEDSPADDGADSEPGSCCCRRRRRDTPHRRSEWFAPLETGCKGYLFLNVPTVNATVTCPTCHAASNLPEAEGVTAAPGAGGAAPSTTEADALPPHTIVVNPLVSRITERIFEDLAANPRPIFRNCFRLMPAELTCCPTLAEMQTALRKLLSLHFAAETVDSTVAADDGVDFAQRILLPSWGADRPRRSMHTIALQLTVKNNTSVEQKKGAIASALTAAIPANRFIVVAQPSHKTKCTVEATVCIFVAHATCVMGVQRRVTERHSFNLHAVGEDAFVLSNAVQVSPKAEQRTLQHE